MSLVSRLRGRKQRGLILDERQFYERDWNTDTVRQWQLDRFNAEWQATCRSTPYFQRLQREKSLPERFSTWQQFEELMPVMDRATLQHERDSLSSSARRPDEWRSTGGSTAEPIQIGVWRSEASVAAQDMWYARGWYGVSPSDRLFLIWGHSHMLGSGVQGRVAGAKRRLKDGLLGYRRWSAYDLSEERLRQAADALLKFRPRYVIAYAVALDRFASVNRDRWKAFHSLGLKVAIATAESFPRPDSVDLIAEVLGCPVAMEYGAVETGPIAHQRPDGKYTVFWRHHFVEGRQAEDQTGTYELLVTCLFPRCWPLVRYKVGDLVSPGSDDAHVGRQFGRVVGRCNDYIVLKDGGIVHSEAFSHVIKDFSSMSGYQVRQSADGHITLNYVAPGQLEAREVEEIRRRFGRIDNGLTGICIERVGSLGTTVAGKTRRVIREHDS